VNNNWLFVECAKIEPVNRDVSMTVDNEESGSFLRDSRNVFVPLFFTGIFVVALSSLPSVKVKNLCQLLFGCILKH